MPNISNLDELQSPNGGPIHVSQPDGSPLRVIKVGQHFHAFTSPDILTAGDPNDKNLTWTRAPNGNYKFGPIGEVAVKNGILESISGEGPELHWSEHAEITL